MSQWELPLLHVVICSVLTLESWSVMSFPFIYTIKNLEKRHHWASSPPPPLWWPGLQTQTMAMTSDSRVQAEVEEEENFGPQPLCRLEVWFLNAARSFSEIFIIFLSRNVICHFLSQGFILKSKWPVGKVAGPTFSSFIRKADRKRLHAPSAVLRIISCSLLQTRCHYLLPLEADHSCPSHRASAWCSLQPLFLVKPSDRCPPLRWDLFSGFCLLKGSFHQVLMWIAFSFGWVLIDYL